MFDMSAKEILAIALTASFATTALNNLTEDPAIKLIPEAATAALKYGYPDKGAALELQQAFQAAIDRLAKDGKGPFIVAVAPRPDGATTAAPAQP